MPDERVLHPIPSAFIAIESGFQEGPPLRVRSRPRTPGARPDTIVLHLRDEEKVAARDFGIEDTHVTLYALHPHDARMMAIELLGVLAKCGDHVCLEVLQTLSATIARLREEREQAGDDSFQDT